MKPEPAPKRRATKQGAKQKAEAVAAKELELAAHAGLTAVVLHAAFFTLSKFRGPHWKLEGEELYDFAHKLTVAVDSVLPEPYLEKFNETLEKFAPVTACVITGIGVVGKRLAFDKAVAAQGKGFQHPASSAQRSRVETDAAPGAWVNGAYGGTEATPSTESGI